ncbi:hypothetical protein EDB85DRAFT_1876641 [Lactarius pseudohatsudake]|nr:hypothetical protein EDB85DRAFT_1876641 [Lactarius pseudohatsudake]
MAYIPWDGRYASSLFFFILRHQKALPRQTHPLLDREKRIIGVLVGQPRDSSWESAKGGALAALGAARGQMTFGEKETNRRRGPFPCVAHGISFGGGQPEPRYLSHSSSNNARVLEELMEDPSIQRICNFGSRAFRAYGKKNYEHMRATVEAIRASHDLNPELTLRRPSDSRVGVFPCRSFNLGEQSISTPHTDDANLAQGWCSITPLGSFDPKKGGHLVLWGLGLIAEFPPGSTALIPSALIKHSNTAIQLGESRMSIIQYAAGGLFRWVENGYMSQKDRLANASEGELLAYASEQDARWARAAGMYTTLDELSCPQEPRR